MRTRNSYFPNNSSVTIPRRRNKRRTPIVVEPELRTIVKVAPMADNRTMEELLQAPTKGYGEAIVIPEINADHFEIKTNLLQLVQVNPYHSFERENPHNRINNFKRITSTLKFRDVPNDVIKLMMFPYSLEGSARVWYDKEPPNSILTWEDLVNKFVNQFFPPSKTTHLKNKISRFTQRFEETFREAWKQFQEMLRACPHHGFKELAQIDTFYNGLNDNDQDSLNAAMGGNLLSKTTREALQIIENKSKKVVTPAPVKVVEESCVTCGGRHAHYNCDATNSNQLSVCVATATYNQVVPQNRASNYMAPPGFTPMQNNSQNRFNQNQGQGNNFNRGNNFHGMDVCHALADLGASINLMPLSIWKKLFLPELTPTQMNLELADRSIAHPKGVAEDIFIKVGKFHFLTDFVVVDFEADPCVPLILRRSFLRTGHALIDVYGEEITLRINDEVVTFNLNQTTRYSSTYDVLLVNRIDIIDIAKEEYAQEIHSFFKILQVAILPRLLSLFFLILLLPSLRAREVTFFEEIEAYLKDDSISLEIDHADCDPEGDIFLIKNLLNNDPFQLPLMDLKQGEVVKAKSSIEEPSELELKDLPSHLEYAYLEGVDKLPVIIAKDLKDNEKEALLKVLKSHKREIAWKITDIKGIDPRLCTHKILMEEDYKPAVQSQRRVNSKIHKVIKKEVIKLLDAEMIYPISDSPWDCIDAFETLKKKLTEAPILVIPDWNLPFELMCDASDFAIGAVLGQRKTNHFQPIHYASKTMTEDQIHYTTTEKEMLVVVKQDAKPRLIRWVLLLQEFDITIRDKKETENLAAEHLSRLENPHNDVFKNKDIKENFPLETLGKISSGRTYGLPTLQISMRRILSSKDVVPAKEEIL
nr:reverse transcriptase domain-containing protein [Tanacetum cinerariifolium]